MIFRLGMTALVVCATSLYFPLNRKLTGGYNLSTRLMPGFRSGLYGWFLICYACLFGQVV